MSASSQWMHRPSDERFESLDTMLLAAQNKTKKSREIDTSAKSLKFAPRNDDGIVVVGQKGEANPSYLASRQISQRLGLGTGLFATDDNEKPLLSNRIICDALNYRCSQMNPHEEIKLLIQQGQTDLTVRSVTSPGYARVFDSEIIPYAQLMQQSGWKLPPARPVSNDQPGIRLATEADVLKLSKAGNGLDIKVGDKIAPAGAYMGDQDSFIFMVDDQNPVDDGTDGSLMRGIFMYNSEVGMGSFGITEFIMQGVCGNHIAWSCTNIIQVKYKHFGDAKNRIIRALENIRIGYKDMSKERDLLIKMRAKQIAAKRVDTIQTVYDWRISPTLTQKVLSNAYDNAAKFRNIDGDPNTWGGLANALTRYSQSFPNMNERHKIDSAVGEFYATAQKEFALT